MGSFRVRSGSKRGPFGVRSGQLRTKISGAKTNFKHFQFARPSPLWRGPSSRHPEPRRPEGPRRSGDGRTNRKYLRKSFRFRYVFCLVVYLVLPLLTASLKRYQDKEYWLSCAQKFRQILKGVGIDERTLYWCLTDGQST